MNNLIAGGAAALLTIFDLDQTFYVPQRFRSGWWRLRFWMVIFVGANALLAVATYRVLKVNDPFKDWHQGLAAAASGVAYLAVIRAKVTTFTLGATEVPFGFELFYEGGKNYCYKRINKITIDARVAETAALGKSRSLHDLAVEARHRIRENRLLSVDEKAEHTEWIATVVEDTVASEDERKLYLATYILSGDQSRLPK